MLRGILPHLVLVGIEHLTAGMGPDRPGRLIQRVRSQKVIMVQQTYKIAPGHPEALIGILRNTLVLSQVTDTDARILLRVLFQDPPDRQILRTGIGDAQLPLRVGLGGDRIHHLPQKSFRRAVHRHDDAETDRIPKTVFFLFFQLFFSRAVQGIPLFVGDLLRFKPLVQADPELLRTIVPEIQKSFFDRIGRKLTEQTAPPDPSVQIILCHDKPSLP